MPKHNKFIEETTVSPSKMGMITRYDFKKGSIEIKNIKKDNSYSIADANGRLLEFGIPEDRFLKIIQLLILHNEYELKKKEWNNAKSKKES